MQVKVKVLLFRDL